MAVLNVTPDSFSDGGAHFRVEDAVAAARRMAAAGADLIDVGGESTRPGAAEVEEAVELERVLPVVQALRDALPTPLSIDTRRPRVAEAAVAAGAEIWNDVSGFRAPGALEAAAALGCHVVIMHMQGEPATMQDDPKYDDVVAEVRAYLETRAEAALQAGVRRSRIVIDPGVGFGKRLEHNLQLLAALDAFVATGFPVLLGASRKGFIRALDPKAVSPGARLGGSLAAALAGARAGCAIIRAHDVAETVQALEVDAAIRAGGRALGA